MLTQLFIENYALIRKMDLSFQPGMTVITGETGAGKSIILGALGLLLGQRADTSVLSDHKGKCVVEGKFLLKGYNLDSFFEEHDIDYDDQTLLRREINPLGKSRAFINDTPVTLNTMKDLGDRLIDIHSQHETLFIRNTHFQIDVLDQYAGHQSLLNNYQIRYLELQKSKISLDKYLEQEKQSSLDRDYYQFLFDELETAQLSPGELELLEEEFSLLSHAGEIKGTLLKVLELLDHSDRAVMPLHTEINHHLGNLASFHPTLKEAETRMNSVYIELKDLVQELEKTAETIVLDPERLNWVQQRIDHLYALLKKHRVQSVGDLMKLKEEYDRHLQQVESLAGLIETLSKEVKEQETALHEMAGDISQSRRQVVPGVEKEMTSLLHQLGMPDARFTIRMDPLPEPGEKGQDQVHFLFSANKGSAPSELGRGASGGELSRIMLAVKSMVSGQKILPTMIFDEIDMGVSGDTAVRVGQILLKLSESKQLVVITHLPQIAGKGSQHFLVFKTSGTNETITQVKVLTPEERVGEIARMISGDSVTDHGLGTARELLGKSSASN